MARGQADRLALRHAYHDPIIHARYESLGANAMLGVAANLNTALRALDVGLRVKRRDAVLEQDASDRLSHQAIYDDHQNPNRHYHVFTRAYDEFVAAQLLSDPTELTQLELQLDQQARSLPNVVARLARRLERLLFAHHRAPSADSVRTADRSCSGRPKDGRRFPSPRARWMVLRV